MISRLLPILVVILAFCSCDKKQSTPQNGQLMIVNASPGLSSPEILVDSKAFGTGSISFPANSGYQNLAGGSHGLKISLTGGPGAVLYDGTVSTIPNAKQSLFLYDQPNTLKVFAVVDNVTVPAAGKANIRFFNLSPGSPIIDAGILSGSTFSTWFFGRAFEDNTTAVSKSAFQSVDAGNYNFQFRVNGAGVVLVNIPSLVLESGKSYTLFAKGVSGNLTTPLGLEVVVN